MQLFEMIISEKLHKMNNLTIEDIHRIREGHAISTRNMSFDEYKANLCKEVKPLLDLLKSMKKEQKITKSYFAKIEPSVVAEPQATYQTKNGIRK